MIEEKQIFRKREEYTIYFVPRYRSEIGILIEFSTRFFLATKQFAKDMKEATKERRKITFPEESVQSLVEIYPTKNH